MRTVFVNLSEICIEFKIMRMTFVKDNWLGRVQAQNVVLDLHQVNLRVIHYLRCIRNCTAHGWSFYHTTMLVM